MNKTALLPRGPYGAISMWHGRDMHPTEYYLVITINNKQIIAHLIKRCRAFYKVI